MVDLVFTDPPMLLLGLLGIGLMALAWRNSLERYAGRNTYLNPLARHVSISPRLRGARLQRVLALAALILVALAASGPVLKGYREEVLDTRYTGRIEIPGSPGVVLVIDVSGSMGGGKIETAKQALLRFIEQLNRTVDLGLIAFSTGIVAAVPPTEKWSRVEQAILGLRAGGGTMYTYPLATALSWLEVYREYGLPAIVVMATDGMPADIMEYKSVVREMAGKGIKAYTVFIGSSPQGIKETRFIAEATGGKQYTAGQIGDLARIMDEIAGEANRIVSNVTVKTRVTVRKEYRIPLAPYLYAATVILIAALSYQRYRVFRLTI
jgi:Ca-activated chloride channel family protein